MLETVVVDVTPLELPTLEPLDGEELSGIGDLFIKGTSNENLLSVTINGEEAEIIDGNSFEYEIPQKTNGLFSYQVVITDVFGNTLTLNKTFYPTM